MTSPALAGASGTVATLESKIRQILINPNTGELESGPPTSESSSEGEADALDTSAGASGGGRGGLQASADKALKLKLKLPLTMIAKSSLMKPTSVSQPTSSSSTMAMTSVAAVETNKSDPGAGPKLPKLILSMRDKTVKQKFSNNSPNKTTKKRLLDGGDVIHNNDSSDDNNASSSVSVTSSEVVSSESGSSSRIKVLTKPNSGNNPSQPTKRTLNTAAVSVSAMTVTPTTALSISTRVPNNINAVSKGGNSNTQLLISSSSSSININNPTTTNSKKDNNSSGGVGGSAAGPAPGGQQQHQQKLQNDRLSAWAKTLGVNSRLEKGAFHRNAINHKADVIEDDEDDDEDDEKPFSSLSKGNLKIKALLN
jgi:hypothetical protein